MKSNVTVVPVEVWNEAQKAELDCWKAEPQDSEDWNTWWSTKFSNYDFLRQEEKFESIYEVGCGPYAKNIQLVCKQLGYTPNRLLLSDPLLDDYIRLNKSVGKFVGYKNVKLLSKPMEQLKFSEIGIEPVDILICNNVLDHVQSVDACFEHMLSSLKVGGILILGQDLTSDEDVSNHPDLVDPCHPIKLDEEGIRRYLSDYTPIFDRVLPREEGRNAEHHYATILFAGRKTKADL